MYSQGGAVGTLTLEATCGWLDRQTWQCKHHTAPRFSPTPECSSKTERLFVFLARRNGGGENLVLNLGVYVCDIRVLMIWPFVQLSDREKKQLAPGELRM